MMNNVSGQEVQQHVIKKIPAWMLVYKSVTRDDPVIRYAVCGQSSEWRYRAGAGELWIRHTKEKGDTMIANDYQFELAKAELAKCRDSWWIWKEFSPRFPTALRRR